MGKYILALDQGTTSSRAIVFGHDGRVVAMAQQEFRQILPSPGVVEHDANEIWSSQLAVAQEVLKKAKLSATDIAAIGVTNQRETTILWDRTTGEPVANAMVWQSRASAAICEKLKEDGHEVTFREKTGLLIDPYFSGTKIKFLLDADPTLQKRAEAGEILFGTVDCWLIWKLTGGRRHVTDVSNASRTLLFNIHCMQWDLDLAEILQIPMKMLPEVLPSSGIFGETDPDIFGSAIVISGAAGDQQAATFGQACFTPGSAKNTYGTGCFMLLNTGDTPVKSKNNLITTIGWQIGDQVTYCLEGSVFVAGAVVQWLRDGMKVIKTSQEIEQLAATEKDSGGVFLVPAFVGLGAPHWDPYARGAIFGITRGTTIGHIARAAVESMAYQSRDLLEAMEKDSAIKLENLKVDGGASVNNELMQFQSDLLGVTVRRPQVAETTALGAAYLAGLAVGYWSDLDEIASNWALDQEFSPSANADEVQKRYVNWQRAVHRTLKWERMV